MSPRDVHPDSDLLFDFVEGVLDRRSAAEVRLHVDRCWQCRAAVTETEEAIREFVAWRRDALLPALEDPPNAWKPLPIAEAPLPVRRIPRAIWLAAAAALALVAAVTVIPRAGEEPVPRQPRMEIPKPAAPPASIPPQPEPRERSAPPREGNVELRIHAVLHRLGLDLGAPVEIVRSGAGWTVTATGLRDEQQEALGAALADLPATRLETSALPAPEIPAPHVSSRAARQSDSPAQAEFEKHFGSRSAFRAFADRALDHSDAILARAHALRALEQRFGAAKLDAGEQALLATIRRDHLEALRALAPEIDADAAVIRAALRLPAPVDATSSPALLASAQKWDRLVSALVAGSGTPPAGLRESIADAAAELQTALRRLP